MTVFSASPTPNLRVFAKVARTVPSGAVAAVVRFYLGGARQQQRRPVLHEEVVPLAGPASTVQQTFQFSDLRAFLEAGRARAAVSGMLSLLPLDLEAECFQAWAGFISSVLGVAASRSMRRNLGGIIGIVRIESHGAAEREEAGGDGFSNSTSPPSEDPSAKALEAATACSTADEDGSGFFGGCSCPICHESLDGGAKVTTTTPCGHGFHGACIGRWLRSRPTCPVCRFVMPEKMLEYYSIKLGIAPISFDEQRRC